MALVNDQQDWESERDALLGRKISELGLCIRGSRVERLVEQLVRGAWRRNPWAFGRRSISSDQWGCPDGTPLIGVPFYLVDARLERIEAEMSAGVEDDRRSDALPASRMRARRQLRLQAVRAGRSGGSYVRIVLASVSRALSRRPVLARVCAAHPRLVRAETSRRRFRRDVRGVADARTRLAARVRRLAGARRSSSTSIA